MSCVNLSSWVTCLGLKERNWLVFNAWYADMYKKKKKSLLCLIKTSEAFSTLSIFLTMWRKKLGPVRLGSCLKEAPSTGWGWIWNAWRLAPDPSLLLHPRILSASFFYTSWPHLIQSSLLETTWKKQFVSLLLASPFALTQRGRNNCLLHIIFFIEYAVSLVEGIFLLNKKEKKRKKKKEAALNS